VELTGSKPLIKEEVTVVDKKNSKDANCTFLFIHHLSGIYLSGSLVV
jgi:hypothetical protein